MNSAGTEYNSDIVFVWSQYDGGNIEQKTIGYGCCQKPKTKEAKLKIVGGDFIWILPTRYSHLNVNTFKTNSSKH